MRLRLIAIALFLANAALPAQTDSARKVTPPDLTVRPDSVAAVRVLAEQGDAKAQMVLGIVYFEGRAVAKDFAEALSWFRKAAAQGNAFAQYYVGLMYMNGQGVAKDAGEAATWYRTAAEQNVAPAQYNLSVLYGTGQGVRKNAADAAQWCRKAAEQGHPWAQFTLGLLYEKGDGVPKDEIESARWHQKAAEQGVAPAQYWVAFYYSKGTGGLPLDQVQAYMWTILAAPRLKTFPSDERKLKRLQRALESKIGAEEIAEARQMAQDWRPRQTTWR